MRVVTALPCEFTSRDRHPYPAGMDEVATYLAAWREAADRVLTLCARLDDADWSRPTDCPGWTVHDVLAHLAHLETALAADEPAAPEPGGREVASGWTNAGVEARRDQAPDTLRAELAAAVLRRITELKRLQPIDPLARPHVTPAGVSWDWGTLLRNRAVDMWVHEQDIRRAAGTPGGMDGVSAQVAVRTLASSLPYVLGKKVAPPSGTVVGWRVRGPVEVDEMLRIDDDRRAVVADPRSAPTARLDMNTETFAVLASGRRGADDVDVRVEGDEGLARRVVAAMGVTP